MIKKILVPQDGSEYSDAAVRCAVWLAKRFNASLSGLHVVDAVSLEGPFLHDISAYMGMGPFIDFSAKMRGLLEAKGLSVLSLFDERCKEAGVTYETEMTFGIVSNEICEKARLADLLVMGRHGINEKFQRGLLGSVTETVVRKAHTPVLMLGKHFKEPVKPLLAYDGGAGSSKVIHSAAAWAKELNMPLTVAAASGASEHALKDAENYLKPYGISASFITLSGDAPTAIERHCKEGGFDIVFMGASRHSRLVEMVLGSTAEHVMRAVDALFFIER